MTSNLQIPSVEFSPEARNDLADIRRYTGTYIAKRHAPHYFYWGWAEAFCFSEGML